MVSFEDIQKHSKCIDENEFFKQYYNEEAKFRYDSNFFSLKYQPNPREFELIEEMQEYFSRTHELEHTKFYWPENKGFTAPMITYFDKHGYEVEMLELYQIDPNKFLSKKGNPKIHIEKVQDETTLDEFKKLSYQADLDIGEDFANPKKGFYDRLFDQSNVAFLLAKMDNQPAGALTMIYSEDYIEIDDVLTSPEFRLEGVATALQQFVMNEAKESNRTVILLADGEDTPKEMYKKQGYEYISYQLGAQKVLDEEEVEE